MLAQIPLGHLGQNPPLARRQDIQRVDALATSQVTRDTARDDRVKDAPAI